jgi:putative transposon-encoded protein
MLVEKLIIAHPVKKKNVCRLEITVYYPKRMQMLQSSGKI